MGATEQRSTLPQLPIADAPGRTVPPLRALGLVGAFTASLIAFCLGYRALLNRLPELGLEGTGAQALKNRYVVDHKDELDAIFVGSSLLFRGIDPAVFDDRMAQLGTPVKSFNFAMIGMFMPEILYTVDWILDRRPARLKWLFIELRELDPVYREQNLRSLRMTSWHSLALTWMRCRVIASSNRTTQEKLEDIAVHLRLFGRKLLNIGLAVPALRLLIYPLETPPDWASYTGHGAQQTQRSEPRRRAPAPPPDREKRSRLAEAPDAAPDPILLEVLAALVERLRAAGVEPIFLLPPKAGPNPQVVKAHVLGVIPTLFAYNEPEVYPVLHRDDLYYDPWHYNRAGATIFTRRLANDFAKHLAGVDSE